MILSKLQNLAAALIGQHWLLVLGLFRLLSLLIIAHDELHIVTFLFILSLNYLLSAFEHLYELQFKLYQLFGQIYILMSRRYQLESFVEQLTGFP